MLTIQSFDNGACVRDFSLFCVQFVFPSSAAEGKREPIHKHMHSRRFRFSLRMRDTRNHSFIYYIALSTLLDCLLHSPHRFRCNDVPVQMLNARRADKPDTVECKCCATALQYTRKKTFNGIYFHFCTWHFARLVFSVVINKQRFLLRSFDDHSNAIFCIWMLSKCRLFSMRFRFTHTWRAKKSCSEAQTHSNLVQTKKHPRALNKYWLENFTFAWSHSKLHNRKIHLRIREYGGVHSNCMLWVETVAMIPTRSWMSIISRKIIVIIIKIRKENQSYICPLISIVWRSIMRTGSLASSVGIEIRSKLS